MRGRIIFTGNFWDYFFKSIGIIVLCLITFGLLVPYYMYWQVKYFVDNLEIDLPDYGNPAQYGPQHHQQPMRPQQHIASGQRSGHRV